MAEAKKKTRKNVGRAIAHIKASFNNTIITITDATGQVIAWDSAGTIGYKGSRKSNPFAAQRAAQKVAGESRRRGVSEAGGVAAPGIGRGSRRGPGRSASRGKMGVRDRTSGPAQRD